ncbi:MAG: 30S ribosomal protein S15 [Candidatus Woesearchaeota archaeon]
MARMHSGAKGKSGSKVPAEKSTFAKMEKKELEMLITKLAKEGKTSAEIGLILRDVYGVPSVKDILGVKVYSFMKEKGHVKKMPEDLRALMIRSFDLRKHVESNNQDKVAKRGIKLTDSKINRLVKFYKEQGVIEADFRYRPAELNLYID